MSQNMNTRIERMYKSDCRNALILVALLWITILFVLTQTWPFIPLTSIKIVVTIAAGLVLLFNTAAIFAMLSHYKEDKEFIYGLDIKFLDQIAEQKANK